MTVVRKVQAPEVLDVALICPKCGKCETELEAVLAWDDSDPIMCSCEHQLALRLVTESGAFGRWVSNVEGVREALKELLLLVNGSPN